MKALDIKKSKYTPSQTVPITNNTYKTLPNGKRIPSWSMMVRQAAKV